VKKESQRSNFFVILKGKFQPPHISLPAGQIGDQLITDSELTGQKLLQVCGQLPRIRIASFQQRAD